ncbi:MAG: SDR family oxidoreductase [Bacteroidota bacterium]
MKLNQKVALITGAAGKRSIGWGIVEAMAQEGASVILNDLPARSQDLDRRVNSLKKNGYQAVAAPADLTRPDEVQKMIDVGLSAFGRLDILCSNAGMIRWQSFLDITPDILQAQVNINVKGNMFVCKAAAEQMIAQGNGGRIIVTSSVQTYFHFPITPVYGGTKHAMHIFVGALALELAPHNITINHIGPGWVKTAMNDASPELRTEADLEKQAEAIPLRRAGTTNESSCEEPERN